MIFLKIYAAIGILVLAAVLFQHQVRKKQEGPFVRDFLASIHQQELGPIAIAARQIVLPAIAGLLIIMVWPVGIVMLLQNHASGSSSHSDPLEHRFEVERKDLDKKVSIEAVEQLERVMDPLGAVPDLPFGHLNNVWAEFCQNLEADDEIWSFRAVREFAWGSEQRSGYVIVRKDQIGSYILTTIT